MMVVLNILTISTVLVLAYLIGRSLNYNADRHRESRGHVARGHRESRITRVMPGIYYSGETPGHGNRF